MKLTSSYQYIGRSNAVSCPNGYSYYILLYAKTVAATNTGKHTVSVRQYLACSNDSTFHGWNTTGYVKVAGTNAFSWSNAKVPAESWSGSSSLTVGGVTYKRHVLLKEGSVTISNCYGNDKDVAITTSWVMNDSYSAGWFPYTGKYATANITVTLAGIAGASTPSVSSTAKMGEKLTISTNRMSTAFTHTLKYTFGGESATIATGVGDSYEWSIPDLAHLCNNALSGKCEISCTTYNGSTAIGTKTVNVTLSVPEPTVPAVSADSLNMDEELTVTVDGKSSNFTHNISYSFDGGKKTGTMATGIKDSASKVFSLADFATVIPDKTSGVLTITCSTYNGTALVGSKTAPVELIVPNNEKTRPSLSMSIAPTPNDAAVPEAFGSAVSFAGMYIQTKSKVTAAYTTSSTYSQIASYDLTVNGVKTSSEESTIQSDLIDGSGTVTVVGRVTDKRGYYTEVKKEITVHPYATPKVVPYMGNSSATCQRSLSNGTADESGLYLLIKAGRSFSSVDGKNACMLRYRYKLSDSGNGYGAYNMLLDRGTASNDFSGVVGNGAFLATNSYDVELSVVDALGGKNSITFSIPTDQVDFHLHNKKAAFGKYAEKDETLEVAWDLEVSGKATIGEDFVINPELKTISGAYSFDGTVAKADSATTANTASEANNALKLEGKTLEEIVQYVMLLENPVGSIKLTTTDVNPGEYLGGTWERWGQGRVPVGLGKPEQNNRDMFGTLSDEELAVEFLTVEGKSGKYWHTLTVDEMPTHSHKGAHGSNTTGTAWVGAKGTSETGHSYTENAGGGKKHNNMPPYVTCYMWKRTA